MEKEYNGEILDGFFVLEGLDGAGTTTQARILHDRLQRLFPRGSVLTCEPTDSFIGKAVRVILREEETVAPGTLAKLFSVDRHNHLYHENEGIVPSLESGLKVISDRYLFSSLAYQSIERPFEEVWELNRYFPLPEHLIFLDISPEEGNRRLEGRGIDREFYEKTELQLEIRENYFHVFSLYQNSAMQIHIFDGALPQEELSEVIWNKLSLSE
jgi:dTMP kinase